VDGRGEGRIPGPSATGSACVTLIDTAKEMKKGREMNTGPAGFAVWRIVFRWVCTCTILRMMETKGLGRATCGLQ
jgi:hypothetical protein